MKTIPSRKKNHGFTLVELLAVIAIVGVMGAVAIPAMGGVFERGETATRKKNAQSIASQFGAAKAAGCTATFSNTEEAIWGLTEGGGLSGRGSMQGDKFFLPLSRDAAAEAQQFLTYDAAHDVMVYQEHGASPVN